MTNKDEALKALEGMYSALKNSMKSAIDIAPTDKTVVAAIMQIEMQYQTIRAALTEAPKVDVPDGWVLVPKEPTTEILKAMFDCGDSAPWSELYKAAITATHYDVVKKEW